MEARIFLVISLALIIYSGLHILLFYLLIKFFGPKSQGIRRGLAAFLFLAASCFITAFIWGRYGSHSFLRGFYYGSALWLGLLVNLLLIFGAGLFLYSLLQRLSLKIDRRTFGVYLIVLTALYTTYGLYHATQININRLSISIPNLPPPWRGKKVAQISDVHLGLINGKTLAQKIADQINREKVGLVFITGDLFDGSGDNLPDLIAPLNRINAPVFFITGNHETYLGIEQVLQVIKKTKIQILRDKLIEIDGLQVIGIDYPPRGISKNLEPILEQSDPKKPSILLYHVPSQIETSRRYHVSLQLSGHTHNGQMWPMKIFTALLYKGFDYGLHQIGDYFIYTSSGVGTWGPPIRIGSTPEIVIITLR